MQPSSKILIAKPPGSREGGVCVRFDHDQGFVVSAWCRGVEVIAGISPDQAKAIAERLTDLEHQGAVHAFTQQAHLFEGDQP